MKISWFCRQACKAAYLRHARLEVPAVLLQVVSLVARVAVHRRHLGEFPGDARVLLRELLDISFEASLCSHEFPVRLLLDDCVLLNDIQLLLAQRRVLCLEPRKVLLQATVAAGLPRPWWHRVAACMMHMCIRGDNVHNGAQLEQGMCTIIEIVLAPVIRNRTFARLLHRRLIKFPDKAVGDVKSADRVLW
jgi:hypothetical protein